MSVKWIGRPKRSNRQRLFDAPVPLVHVRLDADHVDLDACLQTPLDQNVEGGRDVEIIEQQHRIRVVGARRLEHRADQLDAPHLLADARDAVVVLVENRHDHRFVHHIPHVDHAREVGHVAADAPDLRLQNLGVAQRQQPVRRDRMPAERVAFGHAAIVPVELRRVQDAPRVRPAALRLEAPPVERQRRLVEER